MNVLSDYIPQSVNSGAWLTAYTLNELKVRIPGQRIVLPICSLGTPFDELARLGEFVLPPLYHEALDAQLQEDIIARIQRCFPYYAGTCEASNCTATVEHVEARSLNGIVGEVRNYYNVDAPTMLARMLELTRADLKTLAGA
jgi:hypothetical protein